MSRTPREREAERSALRAAADRLLAGTPLRSTSGKLTVSKLISESGQRRDVVYADYRDLVEEFQARVKARDSTPEATRGLAEENAGLADKIAKVKADLEEQRAAGAALRRIVAELSLELQQARDELATAGNVTRLPVRGGGS
ncbi:MAG: hypothetical protein ACRDR6_16795 [Pseudonocardiaceae bacterium]